MTITADEFFGKDLKVYDTKMTETIQQLKEDIAVLQEKLQKLEEIEKQPRMNLQQEGEYAVVSYHDKVYYRLMGVVTFSWYIKKGVSVGYPVPTLMMVNDAETERLLEGLYYNHIQVKKEKVSEEPEDTVWKSVALRFGEKLSDVGPDGYYDFTPEEWFDWVVNTYGKGQQKDYKVGVDEPSMTNCVLLGNPPDGYVAWNEWYNEMGSKGILHNLKISSKDYQPTPQERGERVHKDVERCVRESVKWCEGESVEDWLKPQTPEQVEQGLKEAFREAVKQGVVSSTKSPTLYDLIAEWWCEVFTTNSDWDMETSIEYLVDQISLWLPTEHDTNSYKWNECIRMIREKLR